MDEVKNKHNTERVLNDDEFLKLSNKGKEKNHIEALDKLVDMLIKTYSKEDDLILDPFVGNGTVVLRAIEHKRKGIGIDINDYQKAQLLIDQKKYGESTIYRGLVDIPEVSKLITTSVSFAQGMYDNLMTRGLPADIEAADKILKLNPNIKIKE